MLLCKINVVTSGVWTGIVLQARSTSKEGSGELCMQAIYLLHCTVWSNHAAVPWHMTHYNIQVEINSLENNDKDPRHSSHYYRSYIIKKN